MINPLPIIKAAYPYVVWGFELIRNELRKARNPEPPAMPLSYRDVEHIRKQIDSATRQPKK
jgi:hypothetical protein